VKPRVNPVENASERKAAREVIDGAKADQVAASRAKVRALVNKKAMSDSQQADREVKEAQATDQMVAMQEQLRKGKR